MTDHIVSRRRLLVIAAATLTAGCGENGSDAMQNTRFARNDSKTKTTPTAAPTAVDEGSSVEINIETQTETEEIQRRQQTPDDRTETPEPTPTGTGRLDAAREYLNSSITAYTNFKGVGSVVGVDASMTGFDAAAVRTELSAANEQLDKAAASREVGEQAVTELRTASKALDRLVACQVAVINGYEQFDRALNAAFDEDFGTARDARSKLDLYTSQASDELRLFKSNTSASNFSPVDGISTGVYNAKIDQFSTEISGLEEVQPPMKKVTDGLEKVASGIDRYVGRDYRGAERDLLQSLNGFEIASTNLISVTPPTALRENVSKLKNATDALARGTDHLIESCRDGKEGRSYERKSDRRDAISAYQNSGLVRELPSYQKLTNGD